MSDKVSFLLIALNLIAVLAAGGSLVYTRIIFKKPVITETSERKKLFEKKKVVAEVHEAGYLTFEQTSFNLQPYEGKLHYLNTTFSIQVVDASKLGDLEFLKPLILDRLQIDLIKKPFHELTTVQGRFVLKNQILDLGNKLASEHKIAEVPFSDVHFSEFLIQ